MKKLQSRLQKFGVLGHLSSYNSKVKVNTRDIFTGGKTFFVMRRPTIPEVVLLLTSC